MESSAPDAELPSPIPLRRSNISRLSKAIRNNRITRSRVTRSNPSNRSSLIRNNRAILNNRSKVIRSNRDMNSSPDTSSRPVISKAISNKADTPHPLPPRYSLQV